MRTIYTILLYFFLPFILLRLLWRARKLPAYNLRFKERFGFYNLPHTPSIWVHAVSVGEVAAAIHLIKKLRDNYPEFPILVTTITATGAAHITAANIVGVTHLYLPYDLPQAMQRFFKTSQPVIGIIFETELWPNMLHIAAQKKIPLCLLNARLSANSAKKYRYIASLTKNMLQSFEIIAAQFSIDAERFANLGAKKVITAGSIKFDMQLPANLNEKIAQFKFAFKDRFIWVAASTHEAEEKIILTCHQALLKIVPTALLILVPRHPERFATVYKTIAQNFVVTSYTHNGLCTPATQIFLGDVMGELLLFYALAEVAFVGGSLAPIGGHNCIEPAALAKALIMGPYFFDCEGIVKLFLKNNAIEIVHNGAELQTALLQFKNNKALVNAKGERAFKTYSENQGVLTKQLAIVEKILATNN